MEQLELVLRGCVDKCVKNVDRVVALDHHRQSLVQEGFLAVVISDLSDAPSCYYYHHSCHTVRSVSD